MSRFVLFAMTLASIMACASAEAALLDTAVAHWQFNQFQTIGSGGPNDVADLNGGQSWITRNFNNTVNASSVVGASVTSLNTDELAVSSNTGGFLIHNLSGGGELAPTNNTSYTVFARVSDSVFNGVDDILRVGTWNPGASYYALRTANGKAQFVTRGVGAGSDTLLTHNSTLSTNSWYDVTGVFDSAAQTMTVYVYNPQTGYQIGTPSVVATGYSSLSSTPDNGRNLLIFAAPAFGNGSNDNAQIELAAVWNSALTQSQVASLSTVLITGPPAPVAISNPSFENLLQNGSPYNLPTGAYTAGLNNANVVNLATSQVLTTGVNVQGGYFTAGGGGDLGGVYDDNDGAGQLVITGESGENVAYLNGVGASMSQTLSAVLQPGFYVFSADVGYPLGSFSVGSAVGDLELRVNGVEIAAPDEAGVTGVGVLARLTRTYTILPGDPLIGQPLTISIIKRSGGGSLYFDNLQLTHAGLVPEPSTSALAVFGMALLAGGARRVRSRRSVGPKA